MSERVSEWVGARYIVSKGVREGGREGGRGVWVCVCVCVCQIYSE